MAENPLTIKCPKCGQVIEGITELDVPICIPCTLADIKKRQEEEIRRQEGEIPKREFDEG